METMQIDFGQVINNLISTVGAKEVIKKTGLSEIELQAMPELFNKSLELLDLHYELCSELHNQEQLLLKRK